jgi:cobalt-zinc-cadmium efflux system membrane fusion protein
VRRALAVVLAVVAMAGCGRRRHEAPPKAAADAAAPTATLSAAQLGYLEFGKVEETPAPDVASLGGTIEFDDEHTARLNAVVPGRVTELLVAVGDRVNVDQPLVALESPEVRSAQAEYVRADADLTVARKASERAQRLAAVHAVADKDLLQATEDAQKAAADFDRARAVLDRLRVAQGEPTSRYLLRTPIAGTHVERKAVLGAEASPESAEPLVVVSDLSLVRVSVRVPERQLGLVRAGDAVRVRVDAYPEDFPGHVLAVGAVVDDATRTVVARCLVPNPELRLKPAMFARVTVEAAPDSRLVAVPSDAILSDGVHTEVVVRDADGRLSVRRVEIGVEVDGHVEVRSGLAVGDEIVTRGALFAARALETS